MFVSQQNSKINYNVTTLRPGSWVIGSARGTGCMAQRYAKTDSLT